MNEIFYTFLGIIILFFIFLIFKQFLPAKIKENFCVICASIISSWIILLILNYLEIFNNEVLIALLIGISVAGGFYFIDSKVNEKTKIFKLPLLLSLALIAYSLIDLEGTLKPIFLLGILWIVFGFIYLLSGKNLKSLAKKLVECCKRW